MGHAVCPWWIGIILASPIRKWFQDPEKLLGAFIHEGMTILEPGPGMGFFTVPMARMVGPAGRVIAVDLQAKMLEGLRQRAARAGVLSRIELRQARPDSLGVEDLCGKVDLVVAIAVVHEVPSDEAFFRQAADSLRRDGMLFLLEPRGHVNQQKFGRELQSACMAGLQLREKKIRGRTWLALLSK